MRKLLKGIGALIIGVILFLSMLYFLQEKLIFLPTTLEQDHTYSFTQPFEELFLTAKDGARLNALHFKANSSQGLILYFHGNAGNLDRWGEIVSTFTEMHYDVLVMDYRTYGKSTGKLSENALHKDAQLFYDYALEHYGEDQIILYGRSLGTGIAAKLASENSPIKLVLETPYYSLASLGQERFPFLPVKWFLNYKLETYNYVTHVKCPIYIFHGTADRVVPYTSGKRLYESIGATNKKMYTIEEGEHNNLGVFESYQKGIQDALEVSMN
jgi:alpha-beta hydrolase superfamily lysophospholipase